MLWYPVTEHAEKLSQEGGLAYYDAFALAMNDILDEQCRSIAIPKRITTTMRDIWQLQLRLPRRQGRRANKLMEHPKFRAAFDLLELRANVERRNELQELAVWWDEYQRSNNTKQREMIAELGSAPVRKRHRPRKSSSSAHKPNKNQGHRMELVYIVIGSNLGEPLKQAQQAIDALNALPNSRIVNTSSIYRSKPLGPQDQNDFLNMAVALETELEPEALLDHTQRIELELGRVRKAERWGPRTLDLDIMLFGNHIINTPRLTVPHYGLKEREFMLYPLNDIAPDLIFLMANRYQKGSHSSHVMASPFGILQPKQ